MDPDANLQEQRETAARLAELDDRWAATGEPMNEDEQTEYIDLAGRLAELVRALDHWITNGGFLPAAWAR